MIFDYFLYVFRQFMSGMCQKNQSKREFMLAFNKKLYVKNVMYFGTFYLHKSDSEQFINNIMLSDKSL